MPTYKNLTFACLTPEHHARTCNYWVTVMTDGRSLTAFRTHASFLAWLDVMGLEIDVPLPPIGTHMTGKIEGQYGVRYHTAANEFFAVHGRRMLVLNNGTYYSGKVTGRKFSRTVHIPHFDGRDGLVVDYRTASDRIDAGDYRGST